MTIDADCRICGTPAKEHRTQADEFHQACPRCGEFRISGTAAAVLSAQRPRGPRHGDVKAWERWLPRLARVSGWVRERNMEGIIPSLGSTQVEEIEAMPVPDFGRRLDLLLLYLIRNQARLGDWVSVAPSPADRLYGRADYPALGLVAATWSQDRNEVEFLLRHAVDEGLVERIELQATLTPKGMIKAGGIVKSASGTVAERFSGVRPIALIMTALPIETAAVLANVSTRSRIDHHGTVFHAGGHEGWDVAVAEVGAGNARAAALCERALARFEPKVALFVGVAGGIKDVAIGDVVVATKIYRYEAGKVTEEGFRPRPDTGLTSHAVEQQARYLIQTGTWRSGSAAAGPTLPRLHVGPILAGEKVIATSRGTLPDELQRNYGDALAVDMEGRGFLDAVHLRPNVLGGVVRGISDLLDGKSAADASGSQERAAAHAAAVAFEILRAL